MTANEITDFMTSPFIIRDSDGAILFDTRNGRGDFPFDVAMLEVKSVRAVSDSLYPLIVIDV